MDYGDKLFAMNFAELSDLYIYLSILSTFTTAHYKLYYGRSLDWMPQESPVQSPHPWVRPCNLSVVLKCQAILVEEAKLRTFVSFNVHAIDI